MISQATGSREHLGKPTSLWWDVRESDGRQADIGDTLHFHYEAYVSDSEKQQGRLIESSWDAPPVVVQLGAGRLIRGLEESLAGCRIAGERMIWCPPASAYEDRGLDTRVAGGQHLLIHLWLLDID